MKIIKKKIVVWILILVLALFFVWFGVLAKNYILTAVHKDEIENMQFSEYEEPLTEYDWYRVISYSDTEIEIYYVNTLRKGTDEEYKVGAIITYYETPVGWFHTNESEILWSSAGSADNYIWPYWHHVFLR